jgi:GDP-4-dehydro-6-deoxy-D-mannose reductase
MPASYSNQLTERHPRNAWTPGIDRSPEAGFNPMQENSGDSMRVLITGSEGFTGSHLVEHCLAEGDQVWGTCHPQARAGNLAHVFDRITLRVGDLADPAFISGLLNEARFDLIFNMAGISFSPDADQQPARTFEINLLGAIHLLDAVRTRQRQARVVLASSAEIYGHVAPDAMPIQETQPFAPANIFAAGKAALELAAQPFVSHYGLQVVVARPFNSTGPRQRTVFVCSTFAEQVALLEAGRIPSIKVGDLAPRRDFCDVRDLVRAYRLLALNGQPGEAYNICRGLSVGIQEILDLLLIMARITPEVQSDPARMRKTQVMDVYGSHAKITAACGWEPQIPLEKTLRDLLNFHRQRVQKQRESGERRALSATA